jgi:hypothetical protein
MMFRADASRPPIRHSTGATDEHQSPKHFLQRHDLRQQRLGDVVADLDVLGDLLGSALPLPLPT